ncbi:recombinase family protein [Anthocerotibacter panamensis]|uniref:recombinase family protein n=1 Tax=Anthocerotibacter panamensis TaxID=2857077 RepID=UPI001C406325|nr:recombinase family protein [Anthocerotibacter panamensis]
MLIGYARVSTVDQSLNLQLDALKAAGCTKVFTDTASGSKDDRMGLTQVIEFARSGDTVMVWKLDRLGRSLKHLVETVHGLQDREVGFRSLQESIDTTSSSGKLFFHLFAALAEFERDIIRERTQAGLKAARARGRNGGRPTKLDGKQVAMARTLLSDRRNTVGDVAQTLGVARSTLYRYMDQTEDVDNES